MGVSTNHQQSASSPNAFTVVSSNSLPFMNNNGPPKAPCCKRLLSKRLTLADLSSNNNDNSLLYAPLLLSESCTVGAPFRFQLKPERNERLVKEALLRLQLSRQSLVDDNTNNDNTESTQSATAAADTNTTTTSEIKNTAVERLARLMGDSHFGDNNNNNNNNDDGNGMSKSAPNSPSSSSKTTTRLSRAPPLSRGVRQTRSNAALCA